MGGKRITCEQFKTSWEEDVETKWMGKLKLQTLFLITSGGYKTKHHFIKCPTCGKERWVTRACIFVIKTTKCKNCMRKYMPNGENSKIWKGGTHTSKGYIMWRIRPQEEFYCMGGRLFIRGKLSEVRNILAHRLIMARYIGRPLADNEHVHHINGIRHDNRLENLQLLSDSEHGFLTNKEHCLNKNIKDFMFKNKS